MVNTNYHQTPLFGNLGNLRNLGKKDLAWTVHRVKKWEKVRILGVLGGVQKGEKKGGKTGVLGGVGDPKNGQKAHSSLYGNLSK